MNIYILLACINVVDSYNILLCGNYDKGIYKYSRNNYFWEDNNNIIPISADESQMIFHTWKYIKIGLDYNKYISTDYTHIYKWAPFKDINYPLAILLCKEKFNKKEIHINHIIKNPYDKDFDYDYIEYDIKQFMKNKRYKCIMDYNSD